MTPFVIAGLVTGAVYALVAMGLVLTYRTTGLFNFAHGGIAMVAGYAFHQVRDVWGVPSVVAVPLVVLLVAPAFGVLIDRLMFRSLDGASTASRIVVTLGLLALLRGSVEIAFGAAPINVPSFLPTGTIQLGQTFVGHDQLVVLAVTAAVYVALRAFFARSRTGVAMRAVVDDPDLVAGAGFSPTRLTTTTWALGAGLAGLAGVLFVPLVGLDSVTLSLLVVQAFAAAIVGRLSHLGRTVTAAVALGVASSLTLKIFQDLPELAAGLRPSLPFLLLFGYLLFARRESLIELGRTTSWRVASRVPDAPILAVAAVCLALAFVLPSSRLFVLGTAVVTAIFYLSITLVTGTAGLISLAQAGFAGAGAFLTVHLADAGIPVVLAVVFAAAIVVPFGALVAVPALRLSGLFVALGTFGFGLLVDGLAFTSWVSFSGGQDGLRMTATLPGGERAAPVFAIVMLVAVLAGIRWLRGSALGRTLTAMRDSESATLSLGVDTLWPKLTIFAAGAFVAALGGGVYVLLLQSAGRVYFNTFTSIAWLVAVVVGGVTSTSGALVAAALTVYVPDLLADQPTLAEWVVPAFGLGAILLGRRADGLVGAIAGARARTSVVVQAARELTRDTRHA